MKTCEKCDIEYSDDKKFCRSCGSPLNYKVSIDAKESAKKEVLEERLKSDPLNVEILHGYAQLLFINQLFKETVTVCLKILAINEKNIAAKEILFDTYFKLGKSKEALSVGKQLLSEESNEISFLEKLSEVAAKHENWEDAINYLDIILKEQPAHLNTLQKKVKFLLKNNNFQAATEIFKTLYNEGSRDKITIIYVGISKTLDAEYLNAIELLKPVVENENFEKGNIHDNRGLLYFVYSLSKSLSELTEIERWYSSLNPKFLTQTNLQFDIEVAGSIVQYILRNKLNETSVSTSAKNKFDRLIKFYLNNFPNSDKGNSVKAEMWYSFGMKQKDYNLLDDALNSFQKSIELNFEDIKYKQALNDLKELLQKEKKKRKRKKVFLGGIVIVLVTFIIVSYFIYDSYKVTEDWNIAKRENSLDSFQKFIKSYPDSKYLHYAEQVFDSLVKASCPKAPYIQKNVCPFEGCRYGAWTAKRNVTVFREQSLYSEVVDQIIVGEQVEAISGDIIFTQIGKVVVTESFKEFTKGDTILVLSSQGEGNYSIWNKGKIHSTFIFWKDPKSSGQKIKGEILCPSISNWWVFVKLKSGEEGWVDNTNNLFKGSDIFD